MSLAVGSINLLEGLRKLREPVYSLDYQFIIKDVTNGQMKKYRGQGLSSQNVRQLAGTWNRFGSLIWKIPELPPFGFF